MLRRILSYFHKPVHAMDYGRIDLHNEGRFRLRSASPSSSVAHGPSLKAIYRISDGSYKKEHFPFATKEACLKNFLRVFQLPRGDLFIIADNVGEATWEMVNNLHPNAVRTQIGHGAGSWRYGAFDMALKHFSEDDVVYFVEDDYLHLPGSARVLLEGMAVADYVSLYDHNDKYMSADEGGPNHFIEHGGEITRVIRTPSTHWKVTNSTTMTFATTVKVLREDKNIWDKYTRERHPHDYQAFLTIAQKARSLITPIPGYSTHCEPFWAAPGVDWEKVSRDYS